MINRKKSFFLLSVMVLLLLVVSIGCAENNSIKDNDTVKNESETKDNQAYGMPLPGLGPNTIASIVEEASPAVVKIETVVVEEVNNPFLNDPFFREFFGDSLPPQQRERMGLGSGFIISKDGYVLTNEHVIAGAKEIYVWVKGKEKPIPAEVIGSDYALDLAVLKINAGDDLPTLKMGNSEDIKVGHWVIAIGSPYGLEDTVTVGVISAKERPVTVQGHHFKNLLQTDASINPGNSGGPLLNLKGEVVGINTAVNAEAQGIGFAIPTTTVKEVLNDLIEKGHVVRPWIGVQIQTVTPEIAKYLGIKQEWGVLIAGVVPGSPAEKAGLQRGDVITALDGKKITSSDELVEIIKGKNVGDTLKVEVMRNGQKLDLYVTLAERPVRKY